MHDAIAVDEECYGDADYAVVDGDASVGVYAVGIGDVVLSDVCPGVGLGVLDVDADAEDAALGLLAG